MPEEPTPEESPELEAEPEEYTYAELCPGLPNPLMVGFGLGRRFEHYGAVYAGCGERAIEIGPNTWVSPGRCGSELRSIAIVGEGHKPILLNGVAAEVAWREAREHDLLYAEKARPEGGEVDFVQTREGTLVFARTKPALAADSDHPVRCGEVHPVPDAFAELSSPEPALWLRHLQRWQTWSWPEAEAGSDDVVFRASGLEPAYGTCAKKFQCRLDGPGEHEALVGPVDVSLAEFEAFMPAQTP